MIHLERVSYWYPGSLRAAIVDVSMTIEAGESVGVSGPNESGKSTLCMVAAGLAPAVIGGRLGGTVRTSGAPAMLFDNPSAQLTGLHSTVYEEVAFGPCNLGLTPDEARGRTESALRAVGMEQLRYRDPTRISGGERQLVGLAGLLAMEPQVLILDEPLSRLDDESSELVARAILRLSALGAAMLIAEHDRQFLARVTDRVIEL